MLSGMDLRQRLDQDLKDAMRAKDSVRLETVRNVRGSIRAREIDGGKELTEDEIHKLLRGLVKQRDESIAQYTQGGRADLVERETTEKKILEGYLPAAASAADVDSAVAETIAALGATSMKDMGRVMKAALERLGGNADGKLVSAAVKAKLGG